VLFSELRDNKQLIVNVTKGDKLRIICGGVQEITEEALTNWFKNDVALIQRDLAKTLISRS
jgi:hypothetical protein